MRDVRARVTPPRLRLEYALDMPIGTLFDHGVGAYLAEEGDRPDDLWLFLHIPKTAGSSFGAEIASVLSPSCNIQVDYLTGEKPFLAKLDDAVDGFIGDLERQRFRFATGHIRARHVQRIRQAHRHTKVITMLRDPVKRIISDYGYQRTPMHPLHAQFRDRFPTLESYADDAISRNSMFEHLALDPDEAPAAVVERIEKTFAFAGTLETYPMSFRLMFQLLGAPRTPTMHERKAQPSTESAAAPDPRLIAKIRDANSRDIFIFEHFRHRLAGCREAVWSGLGR